VINKVKTTLSNQITKSFQIGILISVETITGTTLEKKIIAEILITPVVNLVIKSTSCHIAAGNNISIKASLY